jgi:hypothetical protein
MHIRAIAFGLRRFTKDAALLLETFVNPREEVQSSNNATVTNAETMPAGNVAEGTVIGLIGVCRSMTGKSSAS